MKNIKVRVNNEAESKEVQELFFELGGRWASRGKAYNDMVNIGDYIFLTDCNMLNYALGIGKEELTIPQLRDLVVLKRNDVADATHTDQDGWKWYIGADSYVWQAGNSQQLKQWDQSSLAMVDLKPIEKKEMKEFLVNHNDEWTLQLLDADTEENSYRVAVPSGANIYARADDNICTFWSDEYQWLENGKITRTASKDKSFSFSDWQKNWSAEILWQRHTQPEELPFVDDEPKHGHYFKDVSDIDKMDVYEVLKRFEVTDPCLQHIVKKALCAGQRGHKDFKKDLQDILDTAVRAVDINK